MTPGQTFGAGEVRAGIPRFQPDNLAANQALLDRVTALAEDRGASSAQIALAWLLAQHPFIVPIPGTRNEAHLLENLGAQRVHLTADDMQEIKTSLSKFVVYGDRMGVEHMSQIDYTI